jgi:predicted DNA-binding transcriptional regulator AlpA
MAGTEPNDLEQLVASIVQHMMRESRTDAWMNSSEAAAHLRMSKHHFLRLCRRGEGPEAFGEGRLARWRRSTLDAWQMQGKK